MAPSRPLYREPLVVTLVLTNLTLGSLLAYRWNAAPSGMPSGHPTSPSRGTWTLR